MTKSPMSTISYNSEEWLVANLEKLVKLHYICFYMYIFHLGENGDKDHFHIYVQPNKSLDFMDINEQFFTQYVPGQKKPLKCRPWRPSKEEDWILYDLHDPEYLASKDFDGSQDGKIPYSPNDMKYNEDFDWDIAYRRAKATIRTSARSLSIALDKGESVTKLIETGASPTLLTNVMHAKGFDKTNELRKEIAFLKSQIMEIDFLFNHYFQCKLVFDEDKTIVGLLDSHGNSLPLDYETFNQYTINLTKERYKNNM